MCAHHTTTYVIEHSLDIIYIGNRILILDENQTLAEWCLLLVYNCDADHGRCSFSCIDTHYTRVGYVRLPFSKRRRTSGIGLCFFFSISYGGAPFEIDFTNRRRTSVLSWNIIRPSRKRIRHKTRRYNDLILSITV